MSSPSNSKVIDKNRSSKEQQAQQIRDVLIEFDIQTQVNKFAVRCFSDLLENNKQAYEFIQESEIKLTQFDKRLTKTQSFAEGIESNLDSKVEVTKNMTRRLETFSQQFYDSMKENELMIKAMRKDYDALVQSGQKTLVEVRGVSEMAKHTDKSMEKFQTQVDNQLANFENKQMEGENWTQKQMIEVRKELEEFRKQLTGAKADFMAKGTMFEEISQDMTMYKAHKNSLEGMIRNIGQQLKNKVARADFIQMRLMLDSQIGTDRQTNKFRFEGLEDRLVHEVKTRTESDTNFNKRITQLAADLKSTNTSISTRVEKIRVEHQKQIQESFASIKAAKDELILSIQDLGKQTDTRFAEVHDSTQKLDMKIAVTGDSLEGLEKTSQERYNQFSELSSNFDTMIGQVVALEKDAEKRKKEMKMVMELQQKSSIDTTKDGMQILQNMLTSMQEKILGIEESLIERIQVVAGKHDSALARMDRIDETLSSNARKMKETMETVMSDRQDTQKSFTEVNRHISDVSIQIMKAVEKAEKEANKYTDEQINSIEEKLQRLDLVRKQIEQLKVAFRQQMEETKAINTLMAERMEKVTTVLTKFKSDITIRVQTLSSELTRRTLELRQTSKVLEDIRKHVGHITEGVSISLACIAAMEYTAEKEKEPVKISSMVEGWVLQMDDKAIKYRGDGIMRRRLATACLTFISYHADKIKGQVLESGKELYLRMADESKDLFTSRRRTSSIGKRAGSELPKLHI